MSKEPIYSIKVSDMERRIKSLTLLKDRQIQENKKYDFIDDLILKACDASPVKCKRGYEER